MEELDIISNLSWYVHQKSDQISLPVWKWLYRKWIDMSTANDYPQAIFKFQTVCGLWYMVGDKSLQCEQCVWYNLTRITASSRFPVPENLTNSIQYLCCKLLLWWCCCENIAQHIELKTGAYITWQQKIRTDRQYLPYNLLTAVVVLHSVCVGRTNSNLHG